MQRTIAILGVVAAIGLTAGPSRAAAWVQVMKEDPYASDGGQHYYDDRQTYEDRATGWVVTRIAYVSSTNASNDNVPAWSLWAFDCDHGDVRYVGNQSGGSFSVNPGWRAEPHPLTHELMKGVTWELADYLCEGWGYGAWNAGDLQY